MYFIVYRDGYKLVKVEESRENEYLYEYVTEKLEFECSEEDAICGTLYDISVINSKGEKEEIVHATYAYDPVDAMEESSGFGWYSGLSVDTLDDAREALEALEQWYEGAKEIARERYLYATYDLGIVWAAKIRVIKSDSSDDKKEYIPWKDIESDVREQLLKREYGVYCNNNYKNYGDSPLKSIFSMDTFAKYYHDAYPYPTEINEIIYNRLLHSANGEAYGVYYVRDENSFELAIYEPKKCVSENGKIVYKGAFEVTSDYYYESDFVDIYIYDPETDEVDCLFYADASGDCWDKEVEGYIRDDVWDYIDEQEDE